MHEVGVLDNAVGPEQQYFTFLREGVWKIQWCGACSQAIFYPRVHCPSCGSQGLTWIEPSGRGTVYSYTTIDRTAQAGGSYNVCLIDLNEGPRVMSSVTVRAPEELKIGMQVIARLEREQGEVRLVFDPLEVKQ